MTARGGDSKCQHDWRRRAGGYEEYCSPAICIKCGAFGCRCDYRAQILGYCGAWHSSKAIPADALKRFNDEEVSVAELKERLGHEHP